MEWMVDKAFYVGIHMLTGELRVNAVQGVLSTSA